MFNDIIKLKGDGNCLSRAFMYIYIVIKKREFIKKRPATRGLKIGRGRILCYIYRVLQISN